MTSTFKTIQVPVTADKDDVIHRLIKKKKQKRVFQFPADTDFFLSAPHPPTLRKKLQSSPHLLILALL